MFLLCKMTYLPNFEAIATPRAVVLNGQEIAIGNAIVRDSGSTQNCATCGGDNDSVKLPDIVVPEATKSQYKILFEQGYTHLIDEVPEPQKSKNVESKSL
jgi:hypothetical protein